MKNYAIWGLKDSNYLNKVPVDFLKRKINVINCSAVFSTTPNSCKDTVFDVWNIIHPANSIEI